MAALKNRQLVPLVEGDDGTIRVAGSRVTLESIVQEFKGGATPEQIQEDFPSLALRDVYAVVAYYLGQVEAVERYLQAQDREAGRVRVEVERGVDTSGLRQRLRERRLHKVS